MNDGAGRAQGACACSEQERRRVVAALRRGVVTYYQPRNRLAPKDMLIMNQAGNGLGRHGPSSVVGTPNRSSSYGVVAPPRRWGHGVPNAAHPIVHTDS